MQSVTNYHSRLPIVDFPGLLFSCLARLITEQMACLTGTNIALSGQQYFFVSAAHSNGPTSSRNLPSTYIIN